jgi:Protein of unknown function (DUF1360)
MRFPAQGNASRMSDNPREDSRFDGYVAAMGLFAAGIAGSAAVHLVRGTSLPLRYAAGDLVLGALATHKFTRLLAKDAVTAPIRAPFTDYEEPAGSGEVNESPKEGHISHTVGELLTCPFCLAPWVSSAYVMALGLVPRPARAWAAIFSVVAASDYLQHAYARVRTD